jgi:hypothetical protein
MHLVRFFIIQNPSSFSANTNEIFLGQIATYIIITLYTDLASRPIRSFFLNRHLYASGKSEIRIFNHIPLHDIFLKQDQNISSIRCSSWRDKSFKRMYSHFCTRNPNRKLQCHQFHEYMELGEQKCEEGPRKQRDHIDETPGNSEVSRSSSETRG